MSASDCDQMTCLLIDITESFLKLKKNMTYVGKQIVLLFLNILYFDNHTATLFYICSVICHSGPCVFLQRAQCSHCKRCTSYSNSVRPSVHPSVSPSVRLSHAGIVSKRRHVARCSLHRTAQFAPLDSKICLVL